MTVPVITDKLIGYPAETWRSSLSLALWLIDELTEQGLAVPVRLRLRERPGLRPSRNPSGYYLFNDLPAGRYTVVLELGGDELFLRPRLGEPWSQTLERRVAIPLPDPLAPVVELRMVPAPAYPFPATATLIRGRVLWGQEPSAVAVVSTAYPRVRRDDPDAVDTETLETTTDRGGEFVLFLTRNAELQDSLMVTAGIEGGAPRTQSVVFEQGKTTKNVEFTFPA